MRKATLLLLSFVPIVCITLVREAPLPNREAMLVPLQSLVTLCSVGWGGHGVYIAIGLVANVFLFVPLGFALSRIGDIRWLLLIPLLVSLAVEFAQYYTRLGTFEVDDLICHTIGGITAYELGISLSGQREGDYKVITAYLIALGLCCLKSMLL